MTTKWRVFGLVHYVDTTKPRFASTYCLSYLPDGGVRCSNAPVDCLECIALYSTGKNARIARLDLHFPFAYRLYQVGYTRDS